MGLSIHKPRLVTETAKKGKLNFKSGYFQSIMAIFSATVLKLLTLLDGLKKRAFILHCQAIKNSIGMQLNSVCKLNLEKLFSVEHKIFSDTDAFHLTPLLDVTPDMYVTT